MAELTFDTEVRWEGLGREGRGAVSTGGQKLVYSAPASMGGRGIGRSPEELLVSAVASCYSGTLFHLLARDGLPGDEVSVHAVGVVSDYPSRDAGFSRITVSPEIAGADPTRRREYETCGRTARDHCFIGKALRDIISYEVGEVTLLSPARAVAAVS
jgi:peroxiredoxin-like protein